MAGLAEIATASTLAYAVATKLYCPHCGAGLDVRRAVYTEGNVKGRFGAHVCCGRCHDRDVAPQLGNVGNPLVIDGRDIPNAVFIAARRFS